MGKNSSKIRFKASNDDPYVGYLYLPSHPGPGTPGAVAKQICVADYVADYKGPTVYFDLDEEGNLIGIEILG